MNRDSNLSSESSLLADVRPDLARVLKRNELETPPLYRIPEIRFERAMVSMRDGVRLATDLYLPPVLPAPVIVMRTPYGKENDLFTGMFVSFARRGYVVASQDCRGTGESEPNTWDYAIYEGDDGFDFIEWVSNQSWCNGFIGSTGGSYVGITQFPMATHPAMSAVAPSVSGLGVSALGTANLHNFLNAYAKSVGKGEGKVAVHYTEFEGLIREETLSTGYFNEPLHKPFPEALLSRFPNLKGMAPSEAKRWLWEQYCTWPSVERAAFVRLVTDSKAVTIVDVESLTNVFGRHISHNRHYFPNVRMDSYVQSFHAPALLRTGWYDWGVHETLATWDLLMREAPESVNSRSRLWILPSAHNMPGYHEGMAEHSELQVSHLANPEMLLRWFKAVRDGTTDAWPKVIYYLMGANEWRTASAWPPAEVQPTPLYLSAGGGLRTSAPQEKTDPDRYTYDPNDPAPTIGGSLVSYVYLPGSVDVSDAQKRPDVLTYTTPPLEHDVDVVGPLRLILYASSSAVDTDFVGRLSDVFPDGRALQVQNGLLRARYRTVEAPELLEPGRIYRLEIDMFATACRFKAGHRLRLDISSADFPKLDRNTNRGGESGPPISAVQTIFHDPDHPSHLIVPVLGDAGAVLQGV